MFGDTWLLVKDGDARVRTLFDRHYSRRHYKDGRRPKLFVGPGQKMVLLSPLCDALFVWRKFISRDHQEGVNCAVFRNEGSLLSSQLILAAEAWARLRWPCERRYYTYINAKKIKSRNPGYCFLQAGWRRCGYTKRKLLVLEKVVTNE